MKKAYFNGMLILSLRILGLFSLELSAKGEAAKWPLTPKPKNSVTKVRAGKSDSLAGGE